MIRAAFVALAVLVAAPAVAQTAAPQPDARERAADPAARDARRAEIRQVRESCRDETRAKGLRGPDRQSAMKSCVLAKKPELAKPMACAEEARARNLPRGDARRDFMRSCMRAAG
jgi:psiF repeat